MHRLGESSRAEALEITRKSYAAQLFGWERQKTMLEDYSQINDLHPYTRPLTLGDIDSCQALENAAYSEPRDRATRDQLIYRLSKCGELCLGIFSSVLPGSEFKAETLATGKPVETSRSDGAISVLLGYIIATKTDDTTATDDSMRVPEDWHSENPAPTSLGHQEAGRSIVIHSVAVLPAFQGRGIGKILVTAYIQRMTSAGIADNLVLISHADKVEWYENLGFTSQGLSKTQHGSGGWYDMTMQLK
ncbi:hypothetical protein K3495_g10174 [Podosphaera aphanis]|nr:hypothetical protein K3495_g10174 [Podosphaera aphanis]